MLTLEKPSPRLRYRLEEHRVRAYQTICELFEWADNHPGWVFAFEDGTYTADELANDLDSIDHEISLAETTGKIRGIVRRYQNALTSWN